MAEKPTNKNPANQQKSRRQERKSSETHTFRKRRPEKPEIGKNIIYVNTKTSTKVKVYSPDIILLLINLHI